MADIFATKDARKLLHNKFVLLLGDSNMRATYKDLTMLINKNELLSLGRLRKRGEHSFEGDRLIVFSGLTKGRQYEEGREFARFNIHLEYHFITRCYNSKIEMILNRIKSGEMKAPDIIIMNSCVWDVNRWGPNGVISYKENMHKLMDLLKKCLPVDTLVIWTTALPVSTEIRSSLLINQLDFMKSLLRFEVMEANLFCRRLVVSYGYDVLDTHYHLRMQAHRRLQDGIHYGPLPVRFITNLLLTHISLSRDVPLPGNFTGVAIEKVIRNGVLYRFTKDRVQLPTLPDSLSASKKSNENQTMPRKKEKSRKQITSRGGSVNKALGIPRDIVQNNLWTNTRPEPMVNAPPYPFAQPTLCAYLEQPFHCSQLEFGMSNYWNFDQTPGPGPVRKTNKSSTIRHQPY